MEFNHFNKFIIRTPYGFWNNKIIAKEQIALANFDLSSFRSERAEKARLKYLYRTNFRATPFGLFASVGMGKFGKSIEIILNENSYRRTTRFDYTFISNMSEYFLNIDCIKRNIRFYPNNTIYEIGDQYRFIYWKDLINKNIPETKSLERDEIISLILDKCKNGLSIKSILELIRIDVIQDEKVSFVEELIDCGLLVTELNPLIICDDAGNHFLDCLKKIQSRSNRLDQENIEREIIWIKTILGYFGTIDTNGISDTNIEIYNKIYSILDDKSIKYDKNKVFQVDLYSFPTIAVLDESIVLKTNKAIFALSRLAESRPNIAQDTFKKKFLEKWEHQMVPLSIALDPELGIDYNDIDISKLENTNLSDKLIFLTSKLISAVGNGDYEIKIFKNEIQNLPTLKKSLPNTFLANCSIIIEKNEHKVYVDSVGGYTATFMLGRFCNHPEVKQLIGEITDKENSSTTSEIVEIAFLPHIKLGNVIQRPKLTQLTLPIIAHSNDKDENLVNLKDIMVYIANDVINLFDIKRGLTIKPRLTNAHDFSFSHPLYRFLCDLQGQNVTTSLKLDFNNYDKSIKFIPRVVYEDNIILQRAKWVLQKEDLIKPCENWDDKNAIQNFIALKKQLRIPRFISFEGKSTLTIDTLDNKAIIILIHEIKKHLSLKVQEVLFDENLSIVKDGNNNNYNHEIIIPLYKSNVNQEIFTNIPEWDSNLKRKFIIGSEWLYYKIYTGTKISTKLLLELKVLCDDFEQNRKIYGFFFVRYSDPQFHIRLRIKINNMCLFNDLIDAFQDFFNNFISNNTISKIEIGTYERELERYGYNDIENVEAIFFIDSRYVLEIIQKIAEFENHELNTLMAGISIVHMYFDLIAINFYDRRIILKNLMDDNFEKNQLSKKIYRKHSKDIENFIQLHIHSELKNIFVSYKKDIQNVEFQNLIKYIDSIFHMSLNRLFNFDIYGSEQLIYLLLDKYYKSINAQHFLINKNSTL